MKQIVNDLEDYMKAKAHAQIFCSVLSFTLWYKTLDLERKEVQTSTSKAS